MGCSSSSSARDPCAAAGTGTLLAARAPAKVGPRTGGAAKAKGKGSGKGEGKGTSKGKGTGKGKGKGRGKAVMKGRFQVRLEGKFRDYDAQEDAILKRALLVGQPNVRFHLRGQDYEYDFQSMQQKNLGSTKIRDIRPPQAMTAPPAPILPRGRVTVIKVPQDSGATIEIEDPSLAGRRITVAVPPGAKAGAQLAVPLPGKDEDVKAVMDKQKRGWPTAAKVIAGGVGAAGVAVGGVILGEHLTDGAISEAMGISEIATAAEWTEGAVADAAEWTEGAVADAAEWAEGAVADAGEWLADVGEDLGRACVGAVDDAGDWAEDAFEDVTDWIGDVGEDLGTLVMEMF